MVVVHQYPRVAGVQTVDIAGVRWPLFKLEAVALAALTFLILLLVIDPQVAVLAAAAVAVLRWSVAVAARRIRLVS
ncbi:hypothetical protein [Nocardia alni]|uniref:hypothetical protein n=1 Tax=Nocardia alni TaxID=2815723 RepID=UPI001C213724|nr:hypothetical protein [Nocardia alni]